MQIGRSLGAWSIAAGGLLAMFGPSAASRPATASLERVIRQQIDVREASLGEAITRAERDELHELYRAGGYAPLWVDPAGRPNRDARDALALVGRAADEGLDPADYGAARLDGEAAGLESAPAPAAPAIARFDVALSSSALRYLRHLHCGRVDPRAIGVQLRVPADRHDFAAVLRSAIAGHRIAAAAAELQPPLSAYRAMRTMLSRYRSLAASAQFEPLPPVGRGVRPGESYAGLAALCRRLATVGDLPAEPPVSPARARYQEPIVEAIRRFQIRHGLEPDGILGRRTLAALNVPLAWRVRQIELALERLRWLPHPRGRRLVILNIPMFRFWAWDVVPQGGAPAFGMDVIVGRAFRTETPVLQEELREVIFRPYWNVPRSILRQEILPALARDPDYLRKQNMEVVDGPSDGSPVVEATPERIALLAQGAGALRVRQRPGPQNALGLIKFDFPNAESVYMHGTPAQSLFARSRRDFSHGCVRVADPVRLAEWALEGQSEWTRDRIVAAAQGASTIRVALVRPVDVILFYTTAAVMPEDGTIHFADDIYGQDRTLSAALRRRQE